MTTTTTDRIARAATRILEREGPEGVTMRQVATSVGITAMAIYRHYPSRDALLDHIAETGFADLLARVADGPPDEVPTDALSRMLDAYLEYAIERPRIFDLMFSAERVGARRFPQDFQERRSPTGNLFADTVAAAMEGGFLRPGDPWEVGLLLWSQAHGLVTLYRGGRFGLSVDELRALYHRLLREVLHVLGP